MKTSAAGIPFHSRITRAVCTKGPCGGQLARHRRCQLETSDTEGRLNADLKQEMGRRVTVRTTAKLRAAAIEHMAILEQSPERVTAYFQDQRVRYAA